MNGRPGTLRRIVPAFAVGLVLAAAALGAGAAAGKAGAPADAAASALYGPVADALQKETHERYFGGGYYRQNNGGEDKFHYWWNAHALDMLTDAYHRTRSPVYTQRMKVLLHGLRAANGGTYINRYYDDMEWLGLACLRAHELTGEQEYLDVAELLWRDIKTGLSDDLFTWNKDCQPACKNTIGSTPAIILGARLHGLRPSPEDYRTIQTVYATVKEKLVDPATGAVWDGLDLKTGRLNRTLYSYNQGMYIGAGLELHKLSGNSAYLADAVKTADNVLDHLSPGGILYSRERGRGDGGLFKGILARYLALLAREGDIPAATRLRYNEALERTASMVNAVVLRRPEMIMGSDWRAPAPGPVVDFSVQAGGVMLMEAAAILDLPMVYQHGDFNGRSAALPAGSYDTAALAARGVSSDDVASLTVPAGWTVTLYDADRFRGARLVRAANDPRLGDGGWSDRASSIVVAAPPGNDVVTVFSDCEHRGYAVGLPVGSYPLAQLQAKGIANDDIAAVRVRPGFQVTLYQDHNLAGPRRVVTADDKCLSQDGFGDNVSSAIVAPR
jgi:predicted alpha-1,6-mannanase (GH76 family)